MNRAAEWSIFTLRAMRDLRRWLEVKPAHIPTVVAACAGKKICNQWSATSAFNVHSKSRCEQNVSKWSAESAFFRTGCRTTLYKEESQSRGIQ